jgi:hypothetical protein
MNHHIKSYTESMFAKKKNEHKKLWNLYRKKIKKIMILKIISYNIV